MLFHVCSFQHCKLMGFLEIWRAFWANTQPTASTRKMLFLQLQTNKDAISERGGSWTPSKTTDAYLCTLYVLVKHTISDHSDILGIRIVLVIELKIVDSERPTRKSVIILAATALLKALRQVRAVWPWPCGPDGNTRHGSFWTFFFERRFLSGAQAVRHNFSGVGVCAHQCTRSTCTPGTSFLKITKRFAMSK